MDALLYCAGYVANFRVDVRDGSTISEMMRYVIDEFNVPGIMVYADNLFVTVDMLHWCDLNGVNLCGTTRWARGFPAELTFDVLSVCCSNFCTLNT